MSQHRDNHQPPTPAESGGAVVVLGGGGHAKAVLAVVRKLGNYQILGYTDRTSRGTILGAEFLGPDESLLERRELGPLLDVVIGIGQVGVDEVRRALWSRLQGAFLRFPTIVSPRSIVNDEVRIGEATVIMDGAVINSGAVVGRGVIVNTNSTVEHDCELGDWVHIAPGATLSGGVSVGDGCLVGAGATVIESRRIAAGCLIGAGATVVRDLDEPGVYVGCPARRVRGPRQSI